MGFKIGDKVIYPNHGLGVVEKVEEKTILGTTCGFFHLRILSNETTVLVPVANVDKLNLVSKGKNTPSPINIRLTNVPLQTASVCGKTIPYHLHNELLPTVGTTGSNPRSSYIADAMEGNLQGTLSYSIGQCNFVVDSIQLLSGAGGGGKPCNPKSPGCVP